MKVFANRVRLGLLAFSLLAWIAAAAQRDWNHKTSPTGVTAVWAGSIIDPPGGSHPCTFDLHENAGVVTGTVSCLPPNGDSQPISNGKVVGDGLSFDTPGPPPLPGKITTATFFGQIHGNQIRGSFNTVEGEMPIIVTRKEAKK